MKTPFIVAEIGGNHNGSYSKAQALIDAAALAGADAVKFQCFSPEQMAPSELVIESGPWAGRQAVDLYAETWTPRAWFKDLFEYALRRGLVAFSSVFHPDDVDFLQTLDCPIYKIASFELTDTDLIYAAARTKKPLIISTGMATNIEIDVALQIAKYAGNQDVTLLKCTSAYPALLEDANLITLADMRYLHNGAVGLSDHTMGSTAAIVATALGASVIEKHLTLDRNGGGPDDAFSAEPDELRHLVKACREAAKALGQIQYGPTWSEAASLPLRRGPGGKRGELNGV